MSKKENPSDGLFTVDCECGINFPAEDGKCFCGLHRGKLHLDIDKMLNRIYQLHTEDKDDGALDVIFDVYWNLHGMFDVMNDILAKTDVSKLDETILVGFLTQTFKYIKQVPNHLNFCDKVVARMKELGRTDEDISDLVDDYRTTGNYWKSMASLGAPEWLSGPKPKD